MRPPPHILSLTQSHKQQLFGWWGSKRGGSRGAAPLSGGRWHPSTCAETGERARWRSPIITSDAWSAGGSSGRPRRISGNIHRTEFAPAACGGATRAQISLAPPHVIPLSTHFVLLHTLNTLVDFSFLAFCMTACLSLSLSPSRCLSQWSVCVCVCLCFKLPQRGFLLFPGVGLRRKNMCSL